MGLSDPSLCVRPSCSRTGCWSFVPIFTIFWLWLGLERSHYISMVRLEGSCSIVSFTVCQGKLAAALLLPLSICTLYRYGASQTIINLAIYDLIIPSPSSISQVFLSLPRACICPCVCLLSVCMFAVLSVLFHRMPTLFIMPVSAFKWWPSSSQYADRNTGMDLIKLDDIHDMQRVSCEF